MFPEIVFISNIIILIIRTVWPIRSYRSKKTPYQPVHENGVVFYIYSPSQCKGGNRYLNQIEFNARLIIEKDSQVDYSIILSINRLILLL